MGFFSFVKDKILSLFLVIFSLITIEIFLMMYPVNLFIKIYIPIIIFASYVISIIYEYLIKRKYYDNILNILDNLNDKYLITEMINIPEFTDGKILKDILEQVDKSMNENVCKYKYLQEDYKEYIELWIHEIKTPIATTKMIIENNKNSVTKSINEEVDKIENYIEQALFYARSNNVEKDYYVKKCNLLEMVNESIKKNKTILIQERVEINTHDLDNIVNTDSKWIVFILNQIIENSMKYRNINVIPSIEIYSKKVKDSIILYVKDNGIGIKKSDISRVFDKGFTGINGRISGKKSTGIGLYLCKKLCDKLNIAININSKEQEGTIVSLIFPNSSYINLE